METVYKSFGRFFILYIAIFFTQNLMAQVPYSFVDHHTTTNRAWTQSIVNCDDGTYIALINFATDVTIGDTTFSPTIGSDMALVKYDTND